PNTGVFLYGLYAAGLGRMPRYNEFETDHALIANQKTEVEATRLALANAFVDRAEFKRKYPAGMKPAEFVDSILTVVAQSAGVDLGSERSLLISLLDDGANGRA